MTNHAPIFSSSSARVSFSEFANSTGSTSLHQLSGTLNFTDADHTDTHTTSAALHSAVLSSGTHHSDGLACDFHQRDDLADRHRHNGSGIIEMVVQRRR